MLAKICVGDDSSPEDFYAGLGGPASSQLLPGLENDWKLLRLTQKEVLDSPLVNPV
jgi:hypothetical protein